MQARGSAGEPRSERPLLAFASCQRPSSPSRIGSSRTSTRPSSRQFARSSGPVAIIAGAGTGKTRVISRRARLRDRHRPRAAGPGPRRDVHGQGGGRDGRPPSRPWPAGRHGPDVPRPRAEPAPVLLAASARRRAAAAAARLEAAAAGADRPPAAGPLPVHAGQGPRRRDRVGEEPADRAARLRAQAAATARASRRSRSTCSSARFARLRALEGARRADRLRRPPRPRRSTSSRPDAEAAATIRARKRWFSVDEYQDTSPLQQRLLDAVGGRSRATSASSVTPTRRSTRSPARRRPTSTTFADVHPGSRVVELTENYRSTPEILGLANRLLWSAGRPKRLSATRPAGPAPTITRHATDDAELAWLVGRDPGPRGRRHAARRDRGAGADERPARAGRDPR